MSFTEIPEDDTGPPEPPRPYSAWTTISATVVAEDDYGMLTRPAPEHFVVKKGRPGAEALLSETGGLQMPAIEGGTVASVAMDENVGGPEEVAPASDAGAVSSAEQALTVLLADLTKDPDVEGALTTISQEKTPFYAALIRPNASAGGERPSSVSPTEDRPTSPAETGPAGLNGQGRAVSPIVASGDESAAADEPTGEDLDMSAEMATTDAAEAPSVVGESAASTSISLERRRALLADPFVESLLESTLENTLFNLMSEAVHGEFNLHAAPRLIIQNVHENAAEEAAAAAAAAAAATEESTQVPTGLLRSQSGVHQSDAVAAAAVPELDTVEEPVAESEELAEQAPEE